MNEALSQLKENFGVYGSWAIWDNDGNIGSILSADDFQNMLKPNVVFLGLNASMEIPVDWINYHAECGIHAIPPKKPQAWNITPVRRLAEVLQEKEFEPLKGAYMSDIIKTSYDADSAVTAEKARDEKVKFENVNMFKEELKSLSQISGSIRFHIICIGGKSYEIVQDAIKDGWLNGSDKSVYKIYHYSQPYRNVDQEIRRRIREDLFEVIKLLQVN